MSGGRRPGAGALLTLVESARLQFHLTRRYPMLILLSVVQPLALLAIVMNDPGSDPVHNGNLLISVLLTSFWGSTIWAAGGILRRDQVTGTLARTLVNARTGWLVVVGRCAGAIVTSLVTLVATGGLGLLLLGAPTALPSPLWLAAGFLGVAVSGIALGLLIACVFLHTRHGVQITSALMYPVFIFGGLLIPSRLLPDLLAWVPWLVSLSWARRFVVETDLAAGGVFALITAGYGVGGALLFRRSLRHAREKGTLDLV
jgi:ABC-2 type transport system permease protein